MITHSPTVDEESGGKNTLSSAKLGEQGGVYIWGVKDGTDKPSVCKLCLDNCKQETIAAVATTTTTTTTMHHTASDLPTNVSALNGCVLSNVFSDAHIWIHQSMCKILPIAFGILQQKLTPNLILHVKEYFKGVF